jgi:RNA polymerase sigma factor (sigma-70 family)
MRAGDDWPGTLDNHGMSEAGKRARFEALVLPHLGAGYNLARWILKDEVAAEDVVQEASLRAFRFFDGMHGGSARAWFLAVVRNACLDRLQERRRHAADESYDEEAHGAPDEPLSSALEPPEAAAARADEARWLFGCILALPFEYREVLVLRELEELSYKEISTIVGIPIGTVMSRLSRGRDLLQRQLARCALRRTL